MWESDEKNKEGVMPFKVVRPLGDDLVSIAAYNDGLYLYSAQATYIPDEWAEAPEQMASFGYHLTAFQELKNARKFFVYNGYSSVAAQVWECEIDEQVELPKRLKLSVWHLDGVMEPLGFGWPDNTIMAKRIKITRRVPDDELFDYGRV
jgi:hypothetical protein